MGVGSNRHTLDLFVRNHRQVEGQLWRHDEQVGLAVVSSHAELDLLHEAVKVEAFFLHTQVTRDSRGNNFKTHTDMLLNMLSSHVAANTPERPRTSAPRGSLTSLTGAPGEDRAECRNGSRSCRR